MAKAISSTMWKVDAFPCRLVVRDENVKCSRANLLKRRSYD